MSSPLAMVAAAVVAAAGVAFFTTDGAREAQQAREAALVTAPAPVEPATTLKARKPRPPKLSRGDVYAEVYNNSNITGLAGSTAARMSGLGWQVVTTDNWYGTVPASTVYYPERLEKAAKLLSRDIGIARVQPAIDPMSLDRLTVVLTADFA